MTRPARRARTLLPSERYPIVEAWAGLLCTGSGNTQRTRSISPSRQKNHYASAGARIGGVLLARRSQASRVIT